MCILLKLDYAKFGISNLFFHFFWGGGGGGAAPPLGKRRVKTGKGLKIGGKKAVTI